MMLCFYIEYKTIKKYQNIIEKDKFKFYTSIHIILWYNKQMGKKNKKAPELGKSKLTRTRVIENSADALEGVTPSVSLQS